MTKRKLCVSDFYAISRVFTDDIVNMWSIDYKNSDIAPDYKRFEDMPRTAREFVKYCVTHKEGMVEKNGHTTSYRLKYREVKL